jgi:hypothetical protein
LNRQITDRPNIDQQFFIEYLLSITGSDNFVDLSLRVPRSSSHIGDIYNKRAPLSYKFINETLQHVNKDIDNYLEWVSCNKQIDNGIAITKKQKRNDFDQVDFMNFVEKLIITKTKLSRKNIIERINVSESLFHNILREQRILSDETLYKINSVFGINENSYQIYLIDPTTMIDHITSLQLEKLSKK